MSSAGILIINKSKNKTSFSIVSELRKVLQVKKIGHAGTLDPFAEGVMVMLIGKEFTKKSNQFLNNDKEYIGKIHLGSDSDTFDVDGKIEKVSEREPTLDEISNILKDFQGKVYQKPPMYSAKKIKGQTLYKLARKGISIDRQDVLVDLKTTLVSYSYPYLELHIKCSKGTYIRAIANDIGKMLNTGAYLEELLRIRSGPFLLKDALDQEKIFEKDKNLSKFLKKDF